MVAVVSSNPTGGNFIFLFFKTLSVNIVQKCQNCVENEKPDSVHKKVFTAWIQIKPLSVPFLLLMWFTYEWSKQIFNLHNFYVQL